MQPAHTYNLPRYAVAGMCLHSNKCHHIIVIIIKLMT